jgi:hypothetical protein
MLDLNSCSILQVAAVRRMTSDPALAVQCDEWLHQRGIRGARHFLTLWFASLAAGGLMFVWMEFDEMVDAEAPSMRVLLCTGAIVLALIAGFFAFILLVMVEVRSWWWRGGILLMMILVAAWENWRVERRLRR